MAIRMTSKSTQWAVEHPTYQDMNDTNDYLESNGQSALGAVAEANYKTLKAAGSFENGDGAYAERYTDSNGVNNTVDTTNSTSLFSTNKYTLYGGTGNLWGFYNFNGNVNDTSGNGRNLTNTGSATLTTDKNSVSNQAYSFNGSSNYMVSTGYVFPAGTTNVSVAAWIYVAGGAGTNRYIFDTEAVGANGWRFYINSSNVLSVQTQGGSYNPVSVTTLSVGNWYHVAFTSSSSGIVKIYINGVLEATTAGAIGGTVNSNLVYIGNNGNSLGWFNGKIDQLRLYTTELSQGYITYLANASNYDVAFSYNTPGVVIHDTTLPLGNTETVASIYANTQGSLINSGTGDGTDDTEAHGKTLVLDGAATTKYGIAIIPKNPVIIKTVTKHASSTATKCYIYINSVSGLLLQSVSYSGSTATFSTNVVLQAGQRYVIVNDNSGSSFNQYQFQQTNLCPLTLTNTIITGGILNSGTTPNVDYIKEIVSFVTQNITGALTPITTVKVNCSDGTTTTSDVTVDSKGKAIVDISGLSSGSLKVTAKLETTDSSLTPELYGLSCCLR